jgi:hypothetical protein
VLRPVTKSKSHFFGNVPLQPFKERTVAKSGSKPAYRAQERVASQPFLRKLEGEVTKNLRKTEKDTYEPSQWTRNQWFEPFC